MSSFFSPDGYFKDWYIRKVTPNAFEAYLPLPQDEISVFVEENCVVHVSVINYEGSDSVSSTGAMFTGLMCEAWALQFLRTLTI